MAALEDIAALEAGFPRKRCSAAAIIRDSAQRILVVKPSYRDGWLLPGGIVEALESPDDAVRREVREETGFTPKLVSLVCIDHISPTGGFGEAIHFMFDCQDIPAEEALKLRTDGKEIAALWFASEIEATELLLPAVSRRLREVLSGRSGYFHDGSHSLPFRSLVG